MPVSMAYLADILGAGALAPGQEGAMPPPIASFGAEPALSQAPPPPAAPNWAATVPPPEPIMSAPDPAMSVPAPAAPDASFAGVKASHGGPAPMDPPVPVGAPAAPPVNVAGPAQAPPPPVDPNAFDLIPGGVSGSPDRELELRGPKLRHEQDVRNQAFEGAIGTVAGRNEDDAAAAYDMALAQERDARARAAAIDQSAAEQEEEIAQRQADFDSTTRQMGKLGIIDRNRFWATRSTGGKIAAFAEMMLAGLRNAPSYVHKAIDDDVKAQEFAYMAARDQQGARQTAFSMAMAKYQQVGAARAIARAAAIDVTQAQLSQLAAKHQGTEAANRATLAIADLQNEKLAQFQQAYRFLPAQSGGRMWVDPKTGLMYNEAQARAYNDKLREQAHEDRKQERGVLGQVLVNSEHEAAKAANDKGADKEINKRMTVLDGKDAVAVNEHAAQKWNEYNHGRAVFALALNKLKEARDRGDVGAYDAARAQLIEEYPKLLGYTRAPTEGQISHTVGPNAIPEYNHWYNHAKYGPVGAATYSRDQGRAAEKIKFLDETLATSDKAMRQQTFGAAHGKPEMPKSFGEYKK